MCTTSACSDLQVNVSSIFSTRTWNREHSRRPRELERSQLHLNKVWHAPGRNSDYWLDNPLPYISKMTYKCIFRLFYHIHVKPLSVVILKVVAEYVDQTFIWEIFFFFNFFLWLSSLFCLNSFEVSSKRKISHCLLLNCIKECIL